MKYQTTLLKHSFEFGNFFIHLKRKKITIILENSTWYEKMVRGCCLELGLFQDSLKIESLQYNIYIRKLNTV